MFGNITQSNNSKFKPTFCQNGGAHPLTPHCLLMFGTRGGFLLPLTRHFLQHTQSRNKPKPQKEKPINISFLINPFHAPIPSYTETQLHHHQWQTQKSTTITSTTNSPQHNHNLHQKTHKHRKPKPKPKNP